jgi:hypothetical protein
MHRLTPADLEFARRFASGELPPREFDHQAHLRLAYVHLATRGLDDAVPAFRESLLGFLRHHRIDPAKFHETLTQAWLQAAWHFMERAGETTGSEDFLQRSAVLHDANVMLTHYSRDLLYGSEARVRFVPPDLEPIPTGAAGTDARAR